MLKLFKIMLKFISVITHTGRGQEIIYAIVHMGKWLREQWLPFIKHEGVHVGKEKFIQLPAGGPE